MRQPFYPTLFYLSTVLTFIGLALAQPTAPKRAAPYFTTIELEQTMNGWGRGAAYTVILRADGSALYIGKQEVARKGRYTGKFSRARFNQLSQLLQDLSFPNFKTPSSPSPLEQAMTKINAVHEGKREMAVDAEHLERPELLQIKRAMLTLAAQIKWQKVKATKVKEIGGQGQHTMFRFRVAP